MEKDAELLLDAIQIGLEDASTKARELARDTYLLLHKAFPKKAERMKANLPQILQQKINKMEVDAGHVSVSESAVKRRPTVNATKKVNGELNSTGSSAEGEDTVVKNLQQNFRNTGTRRQSTVNPFEEITKGSRSRDPTDDIDTHSLSSIDSAHTSPQKNVHANRSATSSPKIMSGKSSPDKTNDLLIRSTVRKSNSDIDFSTSEAAIAEKLFASRLLFSVALF